MWFITLVKITEPPSKENAMEAQKNMEMAQKMGVKFHQGFFTLGPYDAVWVTEAPDEKVAMQVSMMWSKNSHATTMAAVSFDEVMGWVQKMP